MKKLLLAFLASSVPCVSVAQSSLSSVTAVSMSEIGAKFKPDGTRIVGKYQSPTGFHAAVIQSTQFIDLQPPTLPAQWSTALHGENLFGDLVGTVTDPSLSPYMSSVFIPGNQVNFGPPQVIPSGMPCGYFQPTRISSSIPVVVVGISFDLCNPGPSINVAWTPGLAQPVNLDAYLGLQAIGIPTVTDINDNFEMTVSVSLNSYGLMGGPNTLLYGLKVNLLTGYVQLLTMSPGVVDIIPQGIDNLGRVFGIQISYIGPNGTTINQRATVWDANNSLPTYLPMPPAFNFPLANSGAAVATDDGRYIAGRVSLNTATGLQWAVVVWDLTAGLSAISFQTTSSVTNGGILPSGVSGIQLLDIAPNPFGSTGQPQLLVSGVYTSSGTSTGLLLVQ